MDPTGSGRGENRLTNEASDRHPHPPREHLDRRAITLWRIRAAGEGVMLALFGGGITALLIWQDVFLVWALLPITVVLVLAVVNVLWWPGLLWRQWRYEIRELEVDLQHGVWTVTRTLVPMTRIQHVDTRRGPAQQRLGLASVVFYTAAGSSEIPAL